jgi:hypothetical protein
MKNKLWVFGDSFSDTTDANHDRIWVNQLAKKLDYDLYNYSLKGCSQDYICHSLYAETENISCEDQIIIVATHPIRFWFFENHPDITNPFVTMSDISRIIGEERTRTMELYFKHVQRYDLDILYASMRMAFINNLVKYANWKKILIIFGFHQITTKMSVNNLILSHGSLFSNVSQLEQEDIEENLFNGIDCRYNHLLFENHDVLAQKIYNTLKNNEKLDLTTGFHQNILTREKINDKIFAGKEFDPVSYRKYLDDRDNNMTSWKVTNFFRK